MQYTNHYNLNLPEGSDIVNPLVQDNPNYTAIDGALYANKVRTVGNATEVKSGTVHAITRSDSDIDVIRFTATGNWETGDTMTVDGSPVSVYLPDGTAPLTGVYVINTEVVAIISGSRVTLLLANPYVAPATPTAAEISYDNSGSGLTATDVQDAIDEVLAVAQSGGSITGVLTVTTTVGTVNSAYVYQNGDLKSIVVDITLSQQIIANSAIFSLVSSALYPRAIACGQLIDANNGQVSPVHITTAGACVKSIPVSGDASIAAGHRIIASATYMA